MLHAYRPLTVRKTLVLIGLIVCICASIGAAMTAAWEHRLAAEIAAANQDPYAQVSAQLMALGLCEIGIGLVSVVSSLFTIVAFLMWHYRIAKNAQALGAELRISPGWAVGWWFIPIASLVMPVRSISEISKDSDPPDDDLGFENHHASGSALLLIGAWWTLWIVSNMVGWFSVTTSNAQTPDEIRTSAIVGLASEVLNVGAGALAIGVVLSICGRQARKAMSMPGEPAPPTHGRAF